ncbi:MAG: hypothetical protein IIA45_06255 [Bacteroidetes bacterium]|nr:hypothetical protein [Bacteroidota bacterium]
MKNIFIFLTIFLISSSAGICQKFSALQTEFINKEIGRLVDEYDKYAGLSENSQWISADYIEKFKGLFSDLPEMTFVYNDIDPEFQMLELISVQTYIDSVKKWYYEGLSISVTLKEIVQPVKNKSAKNEFISYAIIEKKVDGLYKDRTIHRATNTLFFMIGFTKDHNELHNFKIIGVYSEKVSLEDQYTNNQKEYNSGLNVQIEKGVIQLLNSYEKYAGLTVNGRWISFEYIAELEKLFINSPVNTSLVNDIDFELMMPEYISLKTYTELVSKWYYGGLDIKLSVKDISEMKKSGLAKKEYTVYAIVEKKVDGLYQDKYIHREINTLYFIISFTKQQQALFNFHIVDIKRNKPERIEHKDVRPKKNFYASVNYVSSFTRIKNDISANSGIYGNWSSESQFGHNAGIDLSYFINERTSSALGAVKIGFGAGFGFSIFKNSIYLSSYENSFSDIDKDGDNFEKRISIDNINELNSLTYIDIPVSLKLKYPLTSRISVFLDLGTKFSFLQSYEYRITGSATYEGYYPDFNVVLSNIAEYGFYTDKAFSAKSNDLIQKQNNVSAFGTLGVSIPLGSHTTFNIAAHFVNGFSDISDISSTDYQLSRNVGEYNSLLFGSSSRVALQSYGLFVGLSFKF